MIETIKKIQVDGVDYDIQAKELTKVTYAELREMRDNGSLAAGHLYRITDYEFTTVQAETKSAGHVFDIIVLATSENQLSHIARAIAHEGDTYFGGNDLGTWELWYDLDNDTTKYAWADTTNGKGVIYRMIDEKRNDCPYDFKNALFYNAELTTDTTTDKYYYTFSYVVSGKLYDGSVEKQVKSCYGNSMGEYRSNGKITLNKNVFRNTAFGNNCYSNTFGNNCYSNTFGRDCIYNKFGDFFKSNNFNSSCEHNTFGGNCTDNTLGFAFKYNIFGDNCTSNRFGSSCQNNTLGNSCHFKTFGDNVSSYKIDFGKTSITLNDEYYDDGSGQLVPVKHPDLSTQPSILPYKFMGQYVYEQLIPVKVGDRVVNCDFEVERPMILSAGVFGVNSFKNVDIIATKSDALLLDSESELDGYINVKYTDASQLLPSNGYGYEDNNTESSALIDFGLSYDGTLYIYGPNTEVLSLYKSGEITQASIPANLPNKIILGEGVTSIGGYAFYGCTNLASITLPEGVTSIGISAFDGCSSLTFINLPASVTNIRAGAFVNCANLASITSKAITPPSIYVSVFDGVNKSIPVYVPAESVDAYKAANYWKDFTNIRAI